MFILLTIHIQAIHIEHILTFLVVAIIGSVIQFQTNIIQLIQVLVICLLSYALCIRVAIATCHCRCLTDGVHHCQLTLLDVLILVLLVQGIGIEIIGEGASILILTKPAISLIFIYRGVCTHTVCSVLFKNTIRCIIIIRQRKCGLVVITVCKLTCLRCGSGCIHTSLRRSCRSVHTSSRCSCCCIHASSRCGSRIVHSSSRCSCSSILANRRCGRIRAGSRIFVATCTGCGGRLGCGCSCGFIAIERTKRVRTGNAIYSKAVGLLILFNGSLGIFT